MLTVNQYHSGLKPFTNSLHYAFILSICSFIIIWQLHRFKTKMSTRAFQIHSLSSYYL